MQMLHPFAGSVGQYAEQLADPDRHRPSACPQCQARHPLTAHGFYTRTLIDVAIPARSPGDGRLRWRDALVQGPPIALVIPKRPE
jgi:hypothetical protein